MRATAEEAALSGEVGSVPVVSAVEAETISGVMIEIKLSATDADGDAVAFRIKDAPRKGSAVIENDTLIYTPADGKTGTDKFTYCALDVLGNCSEPGEIRVKIRKNSTKLTYADMDQNASHYAAIRLHEAGIMTGEKIGASYFFHPNATMTRGEFVAMAVAAGKYQIDETTKTDFIDDEAISPWSKPYISTAAVNGLVQGYHTASGGSEIRAGNPITLDEAASIVSCMITPYLDEPIRVSANEGPDHWAAGANAVLTAVDILPREHSAAGTMPITRQAACDMIYEAYQIMK